MRDWYIRRADDALVEAMQRTDDNRNEFARWAGIGISVDDVRVGDWVVRDDDGRTDVVPRYAFRTHAKERPIE